MPVAALMLLPACDGLFEDFYDNAKSGDEADSTSVVERGGYGFIRTDSENHSGRIYVNAISYTRWTYIDLHSLTVDSLDIGEETLTADSALIGEPEHWDFAIHRYDLKTNGGAGMETELTSIDEARTLTSLPASEWVEDVWTTDRITIDMSHMMEGYLVYLPSYVNLEISKWLNLDLSTMPPIYTMSGRVYLLRMQDGTVAALYLANYMNTKNVKGFMTIDYVYPLF